MDTDTETRLEKVEQKLDSVLDILSTMQRVVLEVIESFQNHPMLKMFGGKKGN